MCVFIFRKICAVTGRPLTVAATAIDPKKALIKTLNAIRENVPEDIKNWPCFSATVDSEMTVALKTDLKALSLWLRMQGPAPVTDKLGDLHYYTHSKIKPGPRTFQIPLVHIRICSVTILKSIFPFWNWYI